MCARPSNLPPGTARNKSPARTLRLSRVSSRINRSRPAWAKILFRLRDISRALHWLSAERPHRAQRLPVDGSQLFTQHFHHLTYTPLSQPSQGSNYSTGGRRTKRQHPAGGVPDLSRYFSHLKRPSAPIGEKRVPTRHLHRQAQHLCGTRPIKG